MIIIVNNKTTIEQARQSNNSQFWQFNKLLKPDRVENILQPIIRT